MTKTERNTVMLMIVIAFPSAFFSSFPSLLFQACSVLKPRLGQSSVISIPGGGVVMAQSEVLEARWAYGGVCSGRVPLHGESGQGEEGVLRGMAQHEALNLRG